MHSENQEVVGHAINCVPGLFFVIAPPSSAEYGGSQQPCWSTSSSRRSPFSWKSCVYAGSTAGGIDASKDLYGDGEQGDMIGKGVEGDDERGSEKREESGEEDAADSGDPTKGISVAIEFCGEARLEERRRALDSSGMRVKCNGNVQ